MGKDLGERVVEGAVEGAFDALFGKKRRHDNHDHEHDRGHGIHIEINTGLSPQQIAERDVNRKFSQGDLMRELHAELFKSADATKLRYEISLLQNGFAGGDCCLGRKGFYGFMQSHPQAAQAAYDGVRNDLIKDAVNSGASVTQTNTWKKLGETCYRHAFKQGVQLKRKLGASLDNDDRSELFAENEGGEAPEVDKALNIKDEPSFEKDFVAATNGERADVPEGEQLVMEADEAPAAPAVIPGIKAA